MTPQRIRQLLLPCGLALATVAPLPLSGCGARREIIVRTADGRGMTADDIDRQPLALLPGDAIGWSHIDAHQLHASDVGRKLLEIGRAKAPIPPSAGFDPERDLDHLFVGVYGTQGVDVVGVAQGRYSPEAISQAADSMQMTPLGAPLVKTAYAGRALYTVRNIGFVVLTPRTALFGSEKAMRRALDRMAEGRVSMRVPAWAVELMGEQSAPLAIAVDLRSQPVSKGLSDQLPMLGGLQTAKILGNFTAPGLNLAGTATYKDETSAATAAISLQNVATTAQQWEALASLFGIAQPIRRVETRPNGKEMSFVAALDGVALGRLLELAAGKL